MKGLLMVPDMATAACEGRKTVTRRVMNPQPVAVETGMGPMWRLDDPPCAHYFFTHEIAPDVVKRRCDYQVGERRPLLTTWAVHRDLDHLKPTELPLATVARPTALWHAGMAVEKPELAGKSRAGRFLPDVLRDGMPMFEIVGVRAERVQSITDADAKAEGVIIGEKRAPSAYPPRCIYDYPMVPETPREAFERLWDSINAKRGPGDAKEGYGWAFNPWVWRVEFRRIKP